MSRGTTTISTSTSCVAATAAMNTARTGRISGSADVPVAVVAPLAFAISSSDQLETISGLQALGFQGFRTVAELRSGALDAVPEGPGLYLVIRTASTPPGFLAIGTGGHFKGKDPNVPIARLAREWVDGALVVYVGQAGTRSAGTLRKRIHQMIRFGEGSPVGHWGGRLVWQLEDAAALQVCWKVVRDTTARTAEKELIGAFKLIRGGRRPFANLRY